MHAIPLKIVLTFAILWTFNHPAAARDCFYPDGTIPTDYTYVACGPETGPESACCGQGHGCSVNGYCMGNAGFMYRGACTDSTWAAPECARHCQNGKYHI